MLVGGLLSAQGAAPKLDRERILNALLTTEFPSDVYPDDGAGDGTLIRYKIVGEHYDEIIPDRTVKAIVESGEEALPLLVSCINDTRLTRIGFEPSSVSEVGKRGVKSTNVPLGYVCLELLTNVAADPRHKANDPDGYGDGICTGARKGFCFRPDVLAINSANGKQVMARTQQRWQQLLKQKQIGYRYPEEWKWYCKTCSPPQ
jgi:hypothetical protein